MLQNLAAGAGLVALNVLIHTAGLILIAYATPLLARRLGFHNHDVGRTLVMTGTVLGLLCILTVEVWSWAIAYKFLGVTPVFETRCIFPPPCSRPSVTARSWWRPSGGC